MIKSQCKYVPALDNAPVKISSPIKSIIVAYICYIAQLSDAPVKWAFQERSPEDMYIPLAGMVAVAMMVVISYELKNRSTYQAHAQRKRMSTPISIIKKRV